MNEGGDDDGAGSGSFTYRRHKCLNAHMQSIVRLANSHLYIFQDAIIANISPCGGSCRRKCIGYDI